MDTLSYKAQVSYNYHNKRNSVFSFLDNLTKAASLFSVTALVVNADSGVIGFWPATALATVSVCLTILSIALDFSGKASLHKYLATEWARFRTTLTKESDKDKLLPIFYSIQEKEPPSLVGLVQLCQDEIEYAEGYPVEPNRMNYFRRVSAHLGFGIYPELENNQTGEQSDPIESTTK